MSRLKELKESENTRHTQQTSYEWSSHMQEINIQSSQNIVSFGTMLRDPIIGYNFLMDNTYEASSSAPTRLEMSRNTDISDGEAPEIDFSSQASRSPITHR